MLAHLRRRIPGIDTHQTLIEDLRLRRRFDLVIGPSSILTTDVNLAVAARHLRKGGRLGMDLMNPHWLKSSNHRGVRIKGSAMELDYRLADGRVVVQVVEGWRPGPAPETARRRLKKFGLELLWMGGRPGMALADSPVYYVLAGAGAGTRMPLSST
jgi:hypothetical protein